MTKLESYGKVVQLGNKMAKGILEGEIIVEEKVDGSQFRAMKTKKGKMLFGSKSVDYSEERPPEKMFKLGIENIKNILESNKIPNKDFQIYGEYLKKPRHNTLSYKRVPEHNVVLFDIKIDNEWIDYDNKKQWADKLGLELPKLLYRGEGKKLTKKKIEELLEIDSILGKEKVEGIVIKNYGKYYDCVKYPYLTGMYMIAKYVREDFKELNRGRWKKIKKGPVETLIDSLRTEPRWRKAVQHLRDKGELEGEPRDIPKVLREIVKDVEEEEKENIKDMLWEHYWKRIKRGIVKGAPEWYKELLMTESLGEDNE